MKKRMKKLMTAMLCVAIAVSAVGCSNGGKEGKGNPEADSGSGATQEITIAYWDADAAFAGDEVLEEVEKKLDIKLKPVNVTWDDYLQKIQLWASSGSLPDVFVGDFRNSKIFAEWATQGVIKAIPEDLSQYPNLDEYMSNEDVVSSAKVDGTIYCIPRKSYPSQEWTATDREIAYRWDLAQKAGITKEPENWEEFDAMIQAIIKADPEGTGIQGLTANNKGLFSSMFLPYASKMVCDQGIAYKWIESKDGGYKPAYFEEDLMPAFQLMRDMYTSGTIEKDIALTNNQTSREKFLQGKSAAILYGGGVGADNYNNLAKYWEGVHGNDFLEDVKVLNLMPDINGEPAYPMTDYAWSETYLNASIDDAKMNKVFELYDYLLSEEGGIFTTYGPEGELYDMEDGKVVLHEGANTKETYPSVGVFESLVRWTPNAYDEKYATSWPDAYNQINRGLAEQAKEIEAPEYNAECTEKVKELGIELSINLEDDVIGIMTGSDPVEKMWDDVYKQYQNNGLDDVVQQVNDALEK